VQPVHTQVPPLASDRERSIWDQPHKHRGERAATILPELGGLANASRIRPTAAACATQLRVADPRVRRWPPLQGGEGCFCHLYRGQYSHGGAQLRGWRI